MKSFIRAKTGKIIFCLLAAFIVSESSSRVFAEEFIFSPSSSGIFKKRTVYNLRIRENSEYKGSVYRELRESYALLSENGQKKTFAGHAYLFEELKNEGKDIARKIDDIIDGRFVLFPDGRIERTLNDCFPLIVGFPAYPPDGIQVKPGDTWTSEGDILVDPLKKGIYTKMRFICAYKYSGLTNFKGMDAHLVSAQYAVRYKKGDDTEGDTELLEVSGSHKAAIYLTAKESLPLFIQDNIDEVYKFPDLLHAVKGFSHTWYSDVVPMDRNSVRSEIARALSESGLQSGETSVTEKNEGIALTINTIHFVADRAELLPGEEKKIDIIAGILKKIADRSFMIIGHTADIGSAESQQDLSVKRAGEIAALLEKSGIDPDRLIFTGKGGSEPAADNSTEEGDGFNNYSLLHYRQAS